MTRDEGLRQAFKAGYHAQWNRSERRYIFDPELVPGDPDGAFEAWLASVPSVREPLDEPTRTTARDLLQHIQRGHRQTNRERFIECSCGTTFWFGSTQEAQGEPLDETPVCNCGTRELSSQRFKKSYHLKWCNVAMAERAALRQGEAEKP